MKIPAPLFEQLNVAFSNFLRRKASEKEMKVPELLDWHFGEYKKAGLTERRALFDVFHAVRKHTEGNLDAWISEFYETCNDDHLHTALKAAIKEARK